MDTLLFGAMLTLLVLSALCLLHSFSGLRRRQRQFEARDLRMARALAIARRQHPASRRQLSSSTRLAK